MSLAEVIIPEHADVVGLSISRVGLRNQFACTIVSIERHGMLISNPDSEEILYPKDKLLLLGTEESLRKAEAWFVRAERQEEEVALSEMSFSHLTVPATSPRVGKSLRDLAVKSHFGVQIVGIERNDFSVLSPGPEESLKSGDQLLVLGTPEQVNEMAFWLAA